MTLPSISTWLFIAGVAAFAVYFPAFIRTIKTLSPEDQKKYSTGPKSLSAVLPVAMVFCVDNPYVNGGLAVMALLMLIWRSHLHHKQLIESGFSVKFVRQLAKVSVLAACSLVFIFTSVVMRGFTNASGA